MRVRCQKCGAEWEVRGRLGVRDECPECAVYMHTCVNCRNYDARQNECVLSTTEAIRDRAGQNFCEEFEYGPGEPPAEDKPSGPTSAEAARRRFEQLFRDPEG